MSAASVRENLMARQVLAKIKAGGFFRGIVASHCVRDSQRVTEIVIRFPLLGNRQICVKNGPDLSSGQKVFVRCVPDPVQPQRYVFQLADSTFRTWRKRFRKT